MIFYAIAINVGLGVFNLIPLPPLDGSKIIKYFLPYNAKVWFENNSFIFEIIFMVIWIFGIASIVISPIIQWITGLLLSAGFFIFGI
ncbi:Peptidase family M50 [compost metagenome]